MQTKAVRLYGKRDLRLESFELPSPGDGEILARVVSDSVCMSTHKAAEQGTAHKRVPANAAVNPVIIGHEFCGEIIEVGARWRDKFSPGDRFSIQPALNDPDDVHAAPGYSFPYIGGAATYIIIPEKFMERGCLLPYDGPFFLGSLAEPVSCIVGGFHVNYHTAAGSYDHKMGIVPGGNMALLAGAGPMGLGAVDYAVNNPVKPGLLVVTDIDSGRLERAARLYPSEKAAEKGVTLKYINTKDMSDVPAGLRALTEGGRGFDDVFVYAPVAPVVEQADALLAYDGCLNFFAGPTNPAFAARFNFYNVHYMATHVAGNSGGNTDDMKEALGMMSRGELNPASMITHVGGLDAVIDTTLNLPSIPGGKKLIYTHITMPLTALDELAEKGYPELAEIVARHGGLWSAEAEEQILKSR